MTDRPVIQPAQMCRKHQYLLCKQAGYGPEDPWRVLIVMAQLALFQGATCDPKTHELIGDDITRISELGCLACFKPDLFGQVVNVARGGLNDIKELGERWILEATVKRVGASNDEH